MITKKIPRIIFGGDYFPEQWTPDVWAQDIALMKQAKVNMVSVAIFAWSLIQPDEDTFCFDWLDKVMDMLNDNDISVCLGTSTAAQPNWLTKKYDDVLLMRDDGNKVTYGSRQTFCLNSPSYRKAVRTLVTEIANYYKDHHALALWHINNEYANKNSMCFCDNCKLQFQQWLKDKYDTIENINEMWGTVFWSERYSNWDEINTPGKSAGGRNATKLLDYKRFLSDSFYSLYMDEYRILRQVTPDIPITTNFEADWSKFDHSQFKNSMDVASFNCYPDPRNMNEARKWVAMRHSMMRCLLDKPFMLMEQSPSQVDWYPVNIAKRPGVMRLWSYQAVANGSDSVMYFQWRASKKGTEKYHSGMVPHYGPESRTFKEIAALGNELEKIDEVIDSQIEADVAILFDNDSWWVVDDPYANGGKSLDNEIFWSSNAQPFPTVLVSYLGELQYYFNSFYDLNVPVDVLPVGYDFSKYKVVVAPLLHLIKPGFKEAVEKFVADGGTFITTYFTGFVDENVGVYLGGYLGPLKDVLGVKVEEYDPLQPGASTKIKMIEPAAGFADEYDCSAWVDIAHTTTAKTLAKFTEDFYAGSPALTVNEYRDGKAYYVATRGSQEFMHDFLSGVLKEKSIAPVSLPEGVELVKRTKDQTTYSFYLNHNTERAVIDLPNGKYIDLLTGRQHIDKLTLCKYGVAVLKEKS